MRAACGLAVVVLALSPLGSRAEEAQLVSGRVVGPSGGPIAGAEVRPSSTAGALPAVVTDQDGAFAFSPGLVREGRLVVRAPGFGEREVSWSVAAVEPLTIALAASRVEEVTVTASRGPTRLEDTASRVVVLSRDAIAATPALTVDDALRQVPGFSLFRRSGSRVANPTTQGASLRGVGPSGTSRTLVLEDGVPLNDPFGGWVYWSRIPHAALDRLEVVEGGASELYGSAALGGVVQAFTRKDAPALAVEASGGNESTGVLSLFAAGRSGDWGARFAGEAFTTDGYVLVADDERGSVDTPAGSSHLNGVATLDRRFSGSASAFLRASVFGESRQNGTPLQVNDTDLQDLSAGADAPLGGGALTARGWYGTQTYHQTFSAVAPDRDSETLTRAQRVPTTSAGGSLVWSRTFATRYFFVAGLEGHGVDGRSDETVYARQQATTQVSAGGRQSSWALFAEGRVPLGSRTIATLGARLDRWTESQGFARSTSLTGGPATSTSYPDRDATTVSPRATVVFRATSHLRLTAAGYGAFRGPSLNELYRSFRVGNTLTLANPTLTEERLFGGEAGLAYATSGERVRVRVVGFALHLDDPVANVTLRSTPLLITRERQNLGQTRSRGLEGEGDFRLASRLRASLGYAFVDATITEFPKDTSLVGKEVPQVARHQGTLQLRYEDPRRLDVAVLMRASSKQFEDDQNQLPLAGFFTLDARVAHRFGRTELFAAGENLTGKRYEVGATPVKNLGPPVLLRAGLRFGWR